MTPTTPGSTPSSGDRRGVLVALGIASAALLAGAPLSFYEEQLPGTLNPLYASSMADYRAQELVFDRLFFHSAIDNRMMSRLVEKGELADGGKSYRVTLKPGLKWHSGTAVTSKDVCFTVSAMLDPGTTSPIAEGYRGVLAGCDATTPQVATVRFTKVFHNPQERLMFSLLPSEKFAGKTAVVPDDDFSQHPIGSGPFKGNKGRRGVTFEAYANAHHAPTIPQMSLQEVQDPLVQVKTLQSNGVQGIIAVPPPYRPDVSASDDLQLKSYDLRSWWFIGVNTKKGALVERKVRQAIDLVLDRSDLRQLTVGVKPGEQNSPCEFISGPFVQSSPFYNRQVPVKEKSDRAAATKLLTEAGLTQIGGRWHYKGAPVTLNIGMMASLDVEAPDLLTQVGNQLSAAGFDRQESKVSADDWARKVVTGKATEFDLLIGKWSFGLVEEVNDLFQTRSGTTTGARNVFNYSNSGADQLMVEYNQARTDTAAYDAYHKLHATLAEDLPYLFLWKLDTKSAWRTEVRGNVIAPFNYWTEVDGWKYQ
ncbi:MAG: ABC transporter substrate-binding protein [Deltaproteobacteria bacterium]|nr:ABC transporter substrate-binding protein [Deltaproteobacteria bacterium]